MRSDRHSRPTLLLLVATAAACLVAPASDAARAEDDGPIRDLCGIAQPVDALLVCRTAPTASAGHAQQPPPSTPVAVARAGFVRSSAVTPRYAPDLLLVTFRKAVSARRIAALLHALGAKLERTIPRIGIRVVHVPPRRRPAILATLIRSRLVRTAQRDPLLQAFDTRPNDTLWPDQWGLRQLDLPHAWDLTRGASTVIVAVIDTGIDESHPDLRGAALPGLNVIDGSAGATDDEGHGTAVAGIIAARTDNHTGQAGVCWNCALLPIKALDSKGVGDTSGIATGIVRAVDLGARVINLSLGGPAPAQALADAVAYAQQKGVVVVAAAGNKGGATPFYPAAYPGVVAVAASDPDRHLYPWSDYGTWIGLAAPGCNVAPTLGGGYGQFCGTSSATPVVAGLAGLAVSANPAATAADIVSALEQSSAPIGAGVRYGEVQAVQTLSALGVRAPASVATTVVQGMLTSTAPTRSFTRALGAGRLAVSLVYTGRGPLTVSVTAPNGTFVARRSGQSPLRFAVPVVSGSYRFALTGRRARSHFVVTLSTTPHP